jgi:hypothetical protein
MNGDKKKQFFRYSIRAGVIPRGIYTTNFRLFVTGQRLITTHVFVEIKFPFT